MSDPRQRKDWWIDLFSTGSALLLAMLLLLGYHWYREREELRENLTMQARMLGANITAAVVFEDGRTATEIIGTVDASTAILEAAIYRVDGSLMARFQRLHTEPQLGDHAPPHGHAFSRQDLRLAVPVHLEGRAIGSIAMRAKLDPLYEELSRLLLSMLLVAAISAALGSYVRHRMRLRDAVSDTRDGDRASLDDVTGLPNQKAFEARLEQALAHHPGSGDGSALVLIGVSRGTPGDAPFQPPIGDGAWRTMAGRLRKALRAGDILGRATDDGFAVILSNVAARDDAEHVARQLLRTAAEPFDVDGGRVAFDFGIGICMLPQDGSDVAGAMRNAATALRHARMTKGNGFRFFHENIDDPASRRLAIEAGLRRALENDGLYLVYQLQRSIRSGRIEGLEALIRWRHPERGIVLPGDFIPIAEETGLIQEIGRVVLDQVCRDIVELRGSGHVVPPVAVNLSPRQILHGTVAEDIRHALKKYRLAPEVLRVELSESAYVRHFAARADLLDDLTWTGVQIAIDNFGAGDSSLRSPSLLPASQLKIDKQLIRDLPDSNEALALVKEIIVMGHDLNLSIVAEGVESSSQAECLQSAGCDLLQGYHIGLPMRKQEMMLVLEVD